MKTFLSVSDFSFSLETKKAATKKERTEKDLGSKKRRKAIKRNP